VGQQQETWWSRHEERERDRILVELGAVLPELQASAHDGQARRTVAASVARFVLREVASAWERGWQPGDVLHLARRTLTASDLEVLRAAIGADIASYPPSTVHPRWHAQLEEFDARRAPSPDGGWLLACGAGQQWAMTVAAAVGTASTPPCWPMRPTTRRSQRRFGSGSTRPTSRPR
jgi:hypothetical protein